jgi:hypothetical protein
MDVHGIGLALRQGVTDVDTPDLSKRSTRVRLEVLKMSVIKSAFLTTLFLLMPSQEPFADTSRQAESTPAATEATETAEATAAEIPSVRVGTAIEGFVWSVSESPKSSRAWTPSSGHREADGYSWSTARAGQGAPADRTQ